MDPMSQLWMSLRRSWPAKTATTVCGLLSMRWIDYPEVVYCIYRFLGLFGTFAPAIWTFSKGFRKGQGQKMKGNKRSQDSEEVGLSVQQREPAGQ